MGSSEMGSLDYDEETDSDEDKTDQLRFLHSSSMYIIVRISGFVIVHSDSKEERERRAIVGSFSGRRGATVKLAGQEGEGSAEGER